jgi:biopolymer transport protein ExbD
MSGLTLADDLPYAGLFPRQQRHADAEFDITAMIDLVFMMNIYFLVTFVTAALGEINLPAANHAVPLDGDKATVITVLAGPDWKTVFVYLGDGKKGTPIVEPEDQATQVASAVEAAAARGKTAVLIKAEKGIRLREMKRIAGAAAREGMTLHIAIMEKDVAS